MNVINNPPQPQDNLYIKIYRTELRGGVLSYGDYDDVKIELPQSASFKIVYSDDDSIVYYGVDVLLTFNYRDPSGPLDQTMIITFSQIVDKDPTKTPPAIRFFFNESLYASYNPNSPDIKSLTLPKMPNQIFLQYL